MRELCERRDRGWCIRKRIFKLHTLRYRTPQCELRIVECDRQPKPDGFLSQKSFHGCTPATRNSRRRRRPMLASTARPSIRPAAVHARFCGQDYCRGRKHWRRGERARRCRPRLVETRLVETRLVETRLVETRFTEMRLTDIRLVKVRFVELRTGERGRKRPGIAEPP